MGTESKALYWPWSSDYVAIGGKRQLNKGWGWEIERSGAVRHPVHDVGFIGVLLLVLVFIDFVWCSRAAALAGLPRATRGTHPAQWVPWR